MSGVPQDDLDGRLAQGWGGSAPDGVHVNVLLARRGSSTAAAITTAFTSPSPGFTPILASLGPDQASYETVNPPTVILTKTEPAGDLGVTLVAGAAQVGISQGVLDVVADGGLAADQEHVVLVSLWIDPAAADETAVRRSARTATSRALAECVEGRSPVAALDLVRRRDEVTHPFYGGS
ncbi:formaldehyde-activating enzyme [uncultured Nocardioides sp.]|uniref:formaldehyde-activating enzyme n=1 Tax=uncultured Nocardioides sp. TaxID=198441 RepID=UPI00262F4919|nr:formaldehyde-activating enzyme [uncultured Nocardioides sp.]